MTFPVTNIGFIRFVFPAVVFLLSIGSDGANAQELTRLNETVADNLWFSGSQPLDGSAQNTGSLFTIRSDGLLQNRLNVDRNLQQTRRPSSVPAKIGGGVLGLVIGGGAGALYGLFAVTHIVRVYEQADLVGAATGTMIGALVGGPIGWGIGSRFGQQRPGHGGFWAASTGAFAGFLVATPLTIHFSERGPQALVLPTMIGLPVAGAIIGRALYASKKRNGEEQNLLGDLPVDVMAGPGPDGGVSFGFRTTF
ncbi:MAG: hypothetical protein OEY63_04975 [Gemmatimonadota bacterium]|nr:hypothetical protein [Gemmatimonadota bacterium]